MKQRKAYSKNLEIEMIQMIQGNKIAGTNRK